MLCMEGAQIDTTPKGDTRTAEERAQAEESMLKLSFIPEQLQEGRGTRELSAIVSVVFGGISLVSWVIMIFGLASSVLGIAFGFIGLKSQHPAHARVGLTLSIIGFFAVFLYAFAAAYGMISNSYFTTQLFN